MPEHRLRVAVFASGRGSNFQAILDDVGRGDLNMDVALCLSNRADAGAIERARSRDVETAIVSPAEYDSDEEYARGMLDELSERDVNLIALAGFMRKVPSQVIEQFRHRILNIHPALLPAFGGRGMYGRRVHEAVVEYGVRWTGATVHIVEEEYDTGPIVLQEPVPVYPDDTADDVAARVLEVEHRLYPTALRLFSQDRIRIEGRRVRILEPEGASQRPSPTRENHRTHQNN